MNADELRALGERLTKIVPADLAAASEILELLAWAEENKVEAVRRRNGYSVHVGLDAHDGDTLLDTLRLAREAAR